MALDGILLHKIIPSIQQCLPMRIQKIWQISNTEVLFQVHTTQGKKQLLISCHSDYNRLLFTTKNYPTPNEPSNFVMVLRKHLEGSIIEDIQQAELDRWCEFKIKHHNDLGDLEYLKLYVELMGKYANIILVNEDNKIIDALKRIPPFENNRRTIHPGATFIPTPSQNKKNPFDTSVIDESETLTKQFAGFSPFLAKEVEYRMNHGQSFSSIMQEIEDSDSLYVSVDKLDSFHCIELKSIGDCRKYDLFEGFDALYYHREEKDRIKQISGDIFNFCKRQKKHMAQKLPRLLKEYDDALDCDKWRLYGDLLYTYNIRDTKGKNSIVLKSYEDESDVTIPLDPKLDGNSNARRCYNKYNKLKKGQIHLQQQIQICEDELNYFEGLLEQLDQADFHTALEIKQELINQGYLKDKTKKKNNKKKKKEELHITTITLPNETKISFGKNNLQNEELTWHKSRKSDLWLHAKDYHGSHCVIHSDNIDEETLRLAANIAAYYSKGRQSSSVEVVYCPIKNLKKIPGAKPGKVQLGSYKTIYIDPDIDELHKYGIED